MSKIKIKIPRESWLLYSVGHPGGSKTIKKPRFYERREHAMSAISHMHYKIGEPGIKIYKEIDENVYFVVMYANFWEHREITSTQGITRRREEPVTYCYVLFKNPTNIEEVEVEAKLPELKFEIVNIKLLYCLKFKDDDLIYGAPRHESEGDPVFIMNLKFKPNIDGWKHSIATMPMYWHNIDGDYGLAPIRPSYSSIIIRSSALPIDSVAGFIDPDFKLKVPECRIHVSEEEENRILGEISGGI